MSAPREPRWRVERRRAWQELSQGTLDLLVIGGGVTGAGIAWQAALRGLRTGLVEKGDWAGATSSRSSKLVHGGLRYLPRGEIGLVRKVGREREYLERRFPRLVTPLPFLIPVYRGYGVPLGPLEAGVWLYDRLAGVPAEHRRRVLRAAGLRELEPLLSQEGLTGGVRYFEARTDDARFVYRLVWAARDAGALALSRVAATELHLAPGGGEALLRDAEDGSETAVKVRAAVLATGPWSSDLDPRGPPIALGLGCHVVVPRKRLPIRHAVALPAGPGSNVFAVPRGPVTYVGTTDRRYEGDPVHPPVADEDVDYLLGVLRRVMPSAQIARRDLLAVFAGVRPLLDRPGRSDTKDLSRRDAVTVRSDGLVSVRGGKLTGFRGVALAVLRRLPPSLRRAMRPPRDDGPEELSHAGEGERSALRAGLDATGAHGLAARYGARTPEALEAVLSAPGGLAPAANGGALWGELDWIADREEVFTLSDLLVRRTGLLWFGGAEDPAALLRDAAARVAPLLGWDARRVSQELEDCAREAYLDRLEELRGGAEGPDRPRRDRRGDREVPRADLARNR